MPIVHLSCLTVLAALFMASVCFAAYAVAIGASAHALQWLPAAFLAARSIVWQGMPDP